MTHKQETVARQDTKHNTYTQMETDSHHPSLQLYNNNYTEHQTLLQMVLPCSASHIQGKSEGGPVRAAQLGCGLMAACCSIQQKHFTHVKQKHPRSRGIFTSSREHALAECCSCTSARCPRAHSQVLTTTTQNPARQKTLNPSTLYVCVCNHCATVGTNNSPPPQSFCPLIEAAG